VPRIPDELIDRIKQATDLVAVIQQPVGLNTDLLRKTGQVYKGRCPFHEEKTPSFAVTPAENLWHCFGCDTGGDVIRFVEGQRGAWVGGFATKINLTPFFD